MGTNQPTIVCHEVDDHSAAGACLGSPFVSVIVLVYNDPLRLRRCLQALEGQTYPKDRFEVVVVDNGSDEPITPVVKPFRQVRLEREVLPGSYAARNRGIAVARGEVLAFTDADCIPAPAWVAHGTAALQAAPGCGLVGGKVEVFLLDPARPTAVELYSAITHLNQERLLQQHHFAATANLFTFRRVIDTVGGFDQELKSGADRLWCQRVLAHGYGQHYSPEARVAHPARRSLRELWPQVQRLAGGGMTSSASSGGRGPDLWKSYRARMFESGENCGTSTLKLR